MKKLAIAIVVAIGLVGVSYTVGVAVDAPQTTAKAGCGVSCD